MRGTILDAWRAGAAFRALDALGAWPTEHALAALLRDPRWPSELLAPLFDMLGDPDAELPFPVRRHPHGWTLMLRRAPGYSLSVAVIAPHQRPSEQVVAGGRRILTRILDGDGALHRWTAGAVGADFTRADAPRLDAERVERVAPGDLARIDGRIEAHRFVTGSAALVAMTLTLAEGAAPLMREYGRADGRLIRIAAPEGGTARTAMLLSLLGVLAPPGACATFDEASRHPAFFIRWRAMATWLALDLRAAAPRLSDMAAADPHPDIRAAAGAVLAGIDRCPA